MTANFLLTKITRTLNFALGLDPLIQDSLQKLAGKNLRLNITAPKLDLLISFYNQQIEITNYSADVNIDCSLQGPPFTLLNLALGNAQNNERIAVHGDIAVLEEIKKLLHNWEFDWEEYLAKYLGDIPANFLGEKLSQIPIRKNEIKLSLAKQLTEYLQEEKEALAPTFGVKYYLEEVDNIRNHYDRLAARINLLTEKIKQK